MRTCVLGHPVKFLSMRSFVPLLHNRTSVCCSVPTCRKQKSSRPVESSRAWQQVEARRLNQNGSEKKERDIDRPVTGQSLAATCTSATFNACQLHYCFLFVAVVVFSQVEHTYLRDLALSRHVASLPTQGRNCLCLKTVAGMAEVL